MNTKDFLTNPKFIKWVNNPDKELDIYWKIWMEANPEHLTQLKLARELLLRIQYKEFEPRTGAKQRILENILNSPEPQPSNPFTNGNAYSERKRNIWEKAGQWTRIAAILLVTLSVCWSTFPHREVISTPILAEAIPKVQKSTAAGEKLQMTLPDGTLVWLNSASSLQFPAQFNGTEKSSKIFR